MTDESNLVPHDTAFARAYADAQRQQAQAEAKARALAELAALAPDDRTYDPWPHKNADPTPADWYSGTGIGALYGIDCEPLAELDGWVIGRE